MTDAPLSVITSADGITWSKPTNIVNGYSDYGLQMHVYRGELYGIMTQTVQYPKQLFATKYKMGEGWKAWRSLPSNMLSQGRVSVTTLEDRFFIVRRGTNDAVYLAWTDNFDQFTDVGRIGSQYAKSNVAPAICAHDGKLYMVGVGDDKYMYYTVADKDGKRLMSWKKIEGTGTQSAVSMAVYDGKLYLFHTGYNNDKFFYQHHTGDSWSSLQAVNTNITSGITATSWKYNRLVVTFRGKDEDVKLMAFDGKSWSNKRYIPNVTMKYQTGVSTWGGLLVVSYAAKHGSSSRSMGYQAPVFMNEKSGALGDANEVTDDEWECKWDENKQQKSWVRKMLCM